MQKWKYSLILDNFSLGSQQLVANYFLHHSSIISERFWPNFDQINTQQPAAIFLAIVETRPKSWKRRTAKNYSRSIEMLLTSNRLHFSWSYWLPKFLLLPYTCDDTKDSVLTASTKSISKTCEATIALRWYVSGLKVIIFFKAILKGVKHKTFQVCGFCSETNTGPFVFPFATSFSVFQNAVLYYRKLSMTGMRLVGRMSFGSLVRSTFSAFTTDKRF